MLLNSLFRRLKGWGLVVISASILLLVGCGASAPPQVSPTPTPLDMESIRSVVRQAVEEASKSSDSSSEEIRTLVEQAVAKALAEAKASGLTAEEIVPIIEKTVSESTPPGITAAEVEALVKEAVESVQDPGKLVVYSGRSQSLVDPIIQQFAATTGIDVEVKYAKTSQLAATIMEEGQNSPADVFFAQDPGGLGAVEGMLTRLPDAVLGRVPDWAHSPQGRWVGISGRARTVVYNTENLTEADLPDDMSGFTDPKWKGRIGWAPTNASFQTMVTAMRAVWGEARARAWLEGIQANDPKVYPKNTPQVAATAAGEIDVGFVNHYYLFRFLAEEGEGFPARNYHPRAGGPGSIVMVAGAGILATSENQANAEKFLSFMLSQVGQQYFASQTFEYPLVEEVKTQRVLVSLSEISSPQVALSGLADLEGTQQLLRDTGILP